MKYINNIDIIIHTAIALKQERVKYCLIQICYFPFYKNTFREHLL